MAENQLASGAVIFRKSGSAIEYLLLRAYNYWDFPKGHVEENEDQVETAKREIYEESNLKNIAFVTKNKEKLFTETLPYGKKNKIARYYLCLVSYEESQNVKLKVNPEIGKPEHEQAIWVVYESAFKLLNDRMRTVLNWANKLIEGSLHDNI
jgi:8-oxo-dGTP pyrophosphatase MutT (NUDIX family)